MKILKWATLVVAFFSVAGSAMAQNMARPSYVAAPVVMSGGFYIWADGTYNRINLPVSRLGVHSLTSGTIDAGPIQTFENRLDGAGVSGAIGYVMPGSTMRFEVGGSYVSADGSSQQGQAVTSLGVLPVFLAGGAASNGTFIGCALGPFSCVASGSQRSDYDAWEINGKAAWDVTLGSVTFSPSLAVFGGNTRNREGLSQTLNQFNAGAPANTINYQADTRLRWTDYGGRVGLDARFPMFGAWTIDAGGWVGVAHRDVTLDGSDSAVTTFAGAVVPVFSGSSSLSVSDNRAVLLANAEAGLSYRFNPNFTIRGFAGLNHDNKVPGISAPTFFTPVAVGPVRGNPASIAYSSETSFYAGGGVSLKF